MRASYSGSTGVSKTSSVGSIPTARADYLKEAQEASFFITLMIKLIYGYTKIKKIKKR